MFFELGLGWVWVVGGRPVFLFGGGGGLFKGGLDGWVTTRALSGFSYWEVLCEGHSKIGDLLREKRLF